MEQRENHTLLSKGAECEPLDLLAPLIANPAAAFEFSFYQSAPDSALDPRRPAKVQGGPQAMAECLSWLAGIREGEELHGHDGLREFFISILETRALRDTVAPLVSSAERSLRL